MSDLDKIGMIHNTDKSSRLHDYLRIYEQFLSPMRQDEFVLVELGVGPSENMGRSLLTWADYFPRAQIVGVDIREDARSIENDRIKIEIGDCGDINFLRHIANKYNAKVILDDASHRWSHQILSFEIMFPSVVAGGIFICEDLGTSYSPWTERKAHPDHFEDAATYYMRLNNVLLGNGKFHTSYRDVPPSALQTALAKEVDWIMTSRETVLVKKKDLANESV